jgi:glutathionyl-hydroquinone reductase
MGARTGAVAAAAWKTEVTSKKQTQGRFISPLRNLFKDEYGTARRTRSYQNWQPMSDRFNLLALLLATLANREAVVTTLALVTIITQLLKF